MISLLPFARNARDTLCYFMWESRRISMQKGAMAPLDDFGFDIIAAFIIFSAQISLHKMGPLICTRFRARHARQAYGLDTFTTRLGAQMPRASAR